MPGCTGVVRRHWKAQEGRGISVCTTVVQRAQEGSSMYMCTGVVRRSHKGMGGQRQVCVFYVNIIGLAMHNRANLCMHKAIL